MNYIEESEIRYTAIKKPNRHPRSKPRRDIIGPRAFGRLVPRNKRIKFHPTPFRTQ